MSSVSPYPRTKQGTPLLSLQLEAEGFTRRFDNPWRSFMEYIGDWHVISRTEDEFCNLVTGNPPRLKTIELTRDASGTNVYFVSRKP